MTNSEIEQCYADLPIDLSDPALLSHLVRVAWHVLPEMEVAGERGSGKMFLAHSLLKGALKAVVPERPGDTIAADAMRRALSNQQTET